MKLQLQDLIVSELVNTHSLAELIYLIEQGRELEFTLNGKPILSHGISLKRRFPCGEMGGNRALTGWRNCWKRQWRLIGLSWQRGQRCRSKHSF